MVFSTSTVSLQSRDGSPSDLLNQINVLNHQFYGPQFGLTVPPRISYPQQAESWLSSPPGSGLTDAMPAPAEVTVEQQPMWAAPSPSVQPARFVSLSCSCGTISVYYKYVCLSLVNKEPTGL